MSKRLTSVLLLAVLLPREVVLVYKFGLCLDTYLQIDRSATLSQRLGYRVKACNSTGGNVWVGKYLPGKFLYPLAYNHIPVMS